MSRTEARASFPETRETEMTVCIGSNFPDADECIHAAIAFIREQTPWRDFASTRVFHSCGSIYGNALLRLRSRLSVEDFERLSKAYEKACGRTAEAKSRGEICIDIDLVTADGQILRDDYYAPYFAEGLRLLDEVESRAGMEQPTGDSRF